MIGWFLALCKECSITHCVESIVRQWHAVSRKAFKQEYSGPISLKSSNFKIQRMCAIMVASIVSLCDR